MPFSCMLIWNLVYVPDLFCRPISPVESTQESLWLINGTYIGEIRATWHISSNIVETREIDLFWDISITNNVKSCKNQWILIDKWHIGERATWHMNEYPSKVNNCTIIQLQRLPLQMILLVLWSTPILDLNHICWVHVRWLIECNTAERRDVLGWTYNVHPRGPQQLKDCPFTLFIAYKLS